MTSLKALSATVLALGVAVASSASAEMKPCDAREIASIIEKKQPETQKACLDSIKGHFELTADVTITAHLAWEANGAVSSVSTSATSFTSAARALDECVTAKVRSWQLGCGPAKRDVPFTFKH